MDLNSYYLHAFDCQNDNPFDGKHSLDILEKILESGGLKSRRLRGDIDTSIGGWNGLDYISLCDYRRKDNKPYNNDSFLKGYNAYETYIKQSLSFVITKSKVNAIKPKLYSPIIFDWESQFIMRNLGNSPKERYSDLVDEVHVKDEISLDRIRAVTMPIKYMISEHKPLFPAKKINKLSPYTKEDIYLYIKELKKLFKKYNVAYQIYDLETLTLLNNEADITKVINILHNK